MKLSKRITARLFLASFMAGFLISVPIAQNVFARVTGTPPARTSPDSWCAGRVGYEVCVDRDGNLIPTTTNNASLGTSSLRYSNTYTTLLNVSGASTLTGNVTVSGTLAASQANISVQLSTAPRTSTTLIYGSTGTLVFNTTDGYLCISTGTAQSSFVIVSATATACGH